MDIDRFIERHRHDWDRLDQLVGTAERRRGRLAAAEIDELVQLYHRASTHLSMAQSRWDDHDLAHRLAASVSRAGALIYGTRRRSGRSLSRFVGITFPAAVWHLRREVMLSFAVFTAAALVLGVWLAASPAALDAAAPEAARAAYVGEQFEAYYTSRPAAEFASTVFTNNLRVGITAFVTGIAAGVPTLVVLALNGAQLGLAGGVFAAAGELGRFFGLVLPHGLPELTAVWIAGGAGIGVGWSIVAPGDRTRGDALREAAGRAATVLGGLVGLFLVAGLIEGFVTGSSLPTAARVGVGVVVEAALVVYVVSAGRAAAGRGVTGVPGERAADLAPAAAAADLSAGT